MAVYQSKDGRTITIVMDERGSFDVSDNEGRVSVYGANTAANIYKDWDLRGVDLTDSGLPPDPDPDPDPDPVPDPDPGSNTQPSDTPPTPESPPEPGVGSEAGGEEA